MSCGPTCSAPIAGAISCSWGRTARSGGADAGVVGEIVPLDQVLPRALEIARLFVAVIYGMPAESHGRCAKYGPNVYRLDEIDGYNSDRGMTIATMGRKVRPERAITVVDDGSSDGLERLIVRER